MKNSQPENLLERVSALLPTPLKKRWISESRPNTPPNELEIERWITERLAYRLGTQNSQIDPAAPFANFGMDSQNALGLSGDLEEWLGTELSPTLVWDYPTVRQLSSYLANEHLPGIPANQTSEIA